MPQLIKQPRRLPTQQEFEDALTRVFNINRELLQDYYDEGEEQVKLYTWRDWMNIADPDGVADVMENESTVYYKYFQFLPEGVTVHDVMSMFLNGQLQSQLAPKRPDFRKIDIQPTDGIQKVVPWQPQELPYYTSRKFKGLYEKARQRVNKTNRQEVYEARKELLFAFNRNPRLADISGIPQRELNDWVRSHAGLNVSTRNLEQSLNYEIPDEHQWLGFSNSSWLSRQVIEPEDVDQFVGEVDTTKRGANTWYGDDGKVLRRYIMNTFLSIDTRISYEDLNFMIGKCGKDSFRGQYFHKATELNGVQLKPRSIVISSVNQNTVAHEIGHYLDYKWGEDYGTSLALTDLRYDSNVHPDHRDWVVKFQEFVNQLENKSDIHSEYTQRRSEVFARFVDRFQRWTSPRDFQRDDYYGDRFDDSDFKLFVRLLQEKSFLDARFPLNRVVTASRISNIPCGAVMHVLNQMGFRPERQHGSHIIMGKPGAMCKPVVPCHGNSPIATGTLRQILRCVGLDVDSFIQMV